MDLHRQINSLAGGLATEAIDGANVGELLPVDRARVSAFMRGVNRIAPLKFEHPGLDTAATRDGDRLLSPNDIGTHDAHMLVLQVVGRVITLPYSDLRRAADGVAPTPLGRAATASNGVAVGEIALDEARTRARHAAGVAVVLVRRDAETGDIAALDPAAGLLTQRAARTSHSEELRVRLEALRQRSRPA